MCERCYDCPMLSVIEIFEKLESVSGRLEKEAIIRENANNSLLQRAFYMALDPFLDYGVRKFKMSEPRMSRSWSDVTCIAMFCDLLQRLDARELTGNSAREAVIAHMSECTIEQQKWCERILLRNLRVGVSDTTVNKQWPGLVRKFAVSLAQQADVEISGSSIKLKNVWYPCRVEPKLDGLRLIAMKKNGLVTMRTRNGNVVETLPRVQAALEKMTIDNVVLDGECMSNAENLAEAWNESDSVMMSTKNKKDDKNITFYVFDCVPIDQWERSESTEDLRTRQLFLQTEVAEAIAGALGGPSDKPRIIEIVTGITTWLEAEILAFYEECLEKGYEGVMIKDLDSHYKFKRSDCILKLKPVTTAEGIIVGWFEGRHNTRHEGSFGGFEVLLPTGAVTKVGSGFKDADRADIMKNAGSYIGRIVECEYQAPLTPDGKMRFPVFSRYRSVKDVDTSIVNAVTKFCEEAKKNNVDVSALEQAIRDL